MSLVTPQGIAAQAKRDADVEVEMGRLLVEIQERDVSITDLFAEERAAQYRSSVRSDALWRLLGRNQISLTPDRKLTATLPATPTENP